MSFIRPEARAALWRWREALSGGLVLLLGLWWTFGTRPGLLTYVGYVTLALGLALILLGIQRGRFRSANDGPGVVRVIEGQITYFGPLTGGAVALSELTEVRLDHTSTPNCWHLLQPGQPPLVIPTNADGSDALFDVFASLPGLSTNRLIKDLGQSAAHVNVIWQRDPSTPPVQRLH